MNPREKGKYPKNPKGSFGVSGVSSMDFHSCNQTSVLPGEERLLEDIFDSGMIR